MEKDEEYELMPHKEIIKLREELEKLKKNPLGRGKKAEDLLESIETLNDSINSLIYVFQHATDELKREPKKEAEQTDLKPLLEKFNELMEQNKEIAEGIVSIAEMIKYEKRKIDSFDERIKPYSRFSEERSSFGPRPEPKPFTPPQPIPQQAPPTLQPRPGFQIPQASSFDTPPPGNPNPMPNFSNKPAQPFPPLPSFDEDNNENTRTPPPAPSFDMPPPPNVNRPGEKKGFRL
jgi:hypothetical protein